MLHSNVWSGSSTLSPICFAFKWASLFLRFYFSQAVTPVVRAAVINSLKSALHQSERNLHIPSLLKFLSVLWRKTAPQTQSKHQKSQFPAGPEVLLHFSEPFSVFLLFLYSIFLYSDEGLSVTVICVIPLFPYLWCCLAFSHLLSLPYQATFSSYLWVSDLSHFLRALCYHLSSLDLCCNVFLCCFCAAANQNNNNKNYLPTNLPWKYLLAALCALTSSHWASASWHEWHLIVTEHLPDSVHSVFLMFLPAHKCCKLFNIKHKLAEGKCCCFIIYCSFFCCPAYG